MNDCPICRGARVIRLPVHRPMSAVPAAVPPTAQVEDLPRTYPCPECANTVPLERVAIVEARSRASLELVETGGAEYREYALRHAANLLAAEMLRGFIQFRRLEPDEQTMTVEEVATVGVVSAKTVASMEERIKARQHAVAERAAEIAIQEMAIWGRDYGSDSIPKAVAAKDVRDAVQKALREYEG